LRTHSSFRLGAFVVAVLAGCNALTGVGDLDPSLGAEDAAEAGPEPVESGADTIAPADVQPIDTGVDAGPCSLAAFCDDFESGNLAKWTSLHQTNGGKVSVVDTPVFAGKHAMYATAGPSTPVSGVYPTVGAGARIAIPLVGSGLLTVRARIYMPKILGAETTFIRVFGQNGSDDMNVKITNGGLVKVDTDNPDAGPELTGSKGTPIAEWFCLEWHATIGAAGHQRLIVDGENVLDADENTSTAGGYDAVQIGFNAANGSVTQEIYFDDFVTGTQPLGCN
jgi:hypothetical protein